MTATTSASPPPRVALLCGGLGMRIREEAEHKPKAMVEIGGKPILWHIMRHYAKHGFHRFVVCLGYKGDYIRNYFLNYDFMHNDITVSLRGGRREVRIHEDEGGRDARLERQAYGWEVTLAETGLKAMTGARIKQIERYVDTDIFLATYGDGLANIDLQALVAFHRSHGKAATITGVPPISRFGTLVTEGDAVVEFSEKPPMIEALINGGFFVFDRRVFSYLSADDNCILEDKPFRALAKDGQLMTFRHEGYWHCMDTPRDVKELNAQWDSGEAGWQL